MLYSKNNAYPGPIPERIRLSSGLTRTGKDYTEEELADAGYKTVQDIPSCEEHQLVEWDYTNGEWVVRNKTVEEIIAENDIQWEAIKQTRDMLLRESDWTQVRDAFSDKDYLAEPLATLWLQYRSILRDVTNVDSPSKVVWPQVPTEEEAYNLFVNRGRDNLEFLRQRGLINE